MQVILRAFPVGLTMRFRAAEYHAINHLACRGFKDLIGTEAFDFVSVAQPPAARIFKSTGFEPPPHLVPRGLMAVDAGKPPRKALDIHADAELRHTTILPIEGDAGERGFGSTVSASNPL